LIRQLLLAACLLILASLSSCKEHTAGLERSIARADETSALAMLHAIAVAERTYSISNSGEYGTLQQLADGGFLAAHYASDKPVRDYIITLNVTPKDSGAAEGSYTCNADPDSSREVVGRHLYIDSTSIQIHVNDTQPASASDKVME
jgi:hypothetical protein